MAESSELIQTFDNRVTRRDARREFFRAALGVGAFAVGGAAALNFSTGASAQAAVTDADILNFALNLEYLEAQFYSYAFSGSGLPADILTGTGTQGAVTTGTGAGSARAVNFSDPIVRQYAREITADEAAHVRFLRTALGTAAVAQPAINISGDANGPFTAAARAAGLVSGTQIFDPYANDINFLLGAFIFEDVGVTAYKGASPLITNNTFLDAAAGILSAEAFHAGIIRSALYAREAQVPSLRSQTEAISDARDSLDGPSNLDQGVNPLTINSIIYANIAPTDTNGIALSRTAAQVLNIVYLNRAAVTMGGFFPAGVNGTIRASAAN